MDDVEGRKEGIEEGDCEEIGFRKNEGAQQAGRQAARKGRARASLDSHEKERERLRRWGGHEKKDLSPLATLRHLAQAKKKKQKLLKWAGWLAAHARFWHTHVFFAQSKVGRFFSSSRPFALTAFKFENCACVGRQFFSLIFRLQTWSLEGVSSATYAPLRLGAVPRVGWCKDCSVESVRSVHPLEPRSGWLESSRVLAHQTLFFAGPHS